MGSIYKTKGPAPQGLQDSAQGFNPGKPHNKRFALKLTRRYLVAPCWKNTRSAGLEVLKGREMRVPDEARTHCRAKSKSAQLGRATIGPSDPASALLGRSIWRPLQGASLLVDDSQGSNPGLSSVAPAGHRTRLQPKDCDLQSIRGKIILYLPTRMIWPSGFGAPPVFSTLMANAAADSMGVAVWKLVRIKPSFGTAKTPALTGCEIFGSITHNW